MNDVQIPSTLVDEGWLNSKGLASRLGISDLTVRRWVRAGKLPPPIRLGRSVRWPWDQVVEWVTRV